jgi:hypothetical protein
LGTHKKRSEVATMNGSRIGCRRPRKVSLGRKCLFLGALLVPLGTMAQTAVSATLAELFGGAFLDVGSARFSNWELISSDSTGGAAPNLSQIIVTPLAGDPLHPGLQFTAGGQWSVSGINAVDVLLKFRASVLAGGYTFTGHTLELTDIDFGSSGGIGFVSDELIDVNGHDLGSAVAIADNETDFFQSLSTAKFAPKSQVVVATNVFITGLSNMDVVSLNSFTQRFDQDGPPGLTGDYNQNGTIDAADYVVWRKHLNQSATIPNDATPGTVSADDYYVWRASFGLSGGPASASMLTGDIVNDIQPAVVPEPFSILLAGISMASVMVARCRLLRRD